MMRDQTAGQGAGTYPRPWETHPSWLRAGRGRRRWLPAVLSFAAAWCCTLLVVGCEADVDERVKLDNAVGHASINEATLDIANGLAAVRHFEDGFIELWAQSPVLELELAVLPPSVADEWAITIYNVMPDALMWGKDAAGQPIVPRSTTLRATAIRWTLDAADARATEADEPLVLTVAPPDYETQDSFRFAVLSDIQDDLDRFQDIVLKLNGDPSIRFVVSTGDLVETGDRGLLKRFQRELETLERPFFSTVGNHEQILGNARDWAELFGRSSFHFEVKGTHFSFVDSASGTVHLTTYEWLEEWLDEALDAPHVFVSHIPPLDPFGMRSGSYASRKEAGKMLALLASHDVDITFYGHIHSYYAFSNAGIPAYISGGGGAIPERLDGIERHYLQVDVVPRQQILEVTVIRVD